MLLSEKIQILPIWLLNAIASLWILYVIYKTGKYKIILNDIQNPLFLITILFMILFLFFTVDENTARSQEANKHAILAGVAAYFGHLDMTLPAFFISGMYVYSTFNQNARKELSIDWGMDPSVTQEEASQTIYLGQGWNQNKQVI